MKKVLSVGIVLSLLITMTAGCSSSKNTPNESTKAQEESVAAQTTNTDGKKSEESGLQEVNVILDYVPNTNHTGMYAAKELGYYKDAGLDVNIVEPADGVTPTLVAVGKGDFGITYQEDATYALTSEDALPITAIATLIQHNTSGFVSFKGKNITSPKDFEGKTYAGWGSPAEEAIIKAVMTNEGADFSKLNIVTSDSFNYDMLKDSIDLMWYFEAWDCIAAKRAGVELNYIPLRDYDERLDYYTPIIIANNDVLKNDPEMVKKFLSATQKGYQYAIDNPDDAAEILHGYAPDYDIDMLKESQEYLAGKYIDDADRWGVMSSKVWDNYTDFMFEKGLITKKIPAENCYTNDFLPE